MEQVIYNLITGYIVIMSIVGFALMGIDKQRAKKHSWRIPERTLIVTALIGGGIGSFMGMYIFRHKTKHKKFTILLPLAAGLDAIVLLKLNNVI